MNVQIVADSRIAGRNNVRLTFEIESNMADESLVEDRIDRLAIVFAAAWEALYCRAISLCSIQSSSFQETEMPTGQVPSNKMNFQPSGSSFLLCRTWCRRS